jgi:hypothetical protein
VEKICVKNPSRVLTLILMILFIDLRTKQSHLPIYLFAERKGLIHPGLAANPNLLYNSLRLTKIPEMGIGSKVNGLVALMAYLAYWLAGFC